MAQNQTFRDQSSVPSAPSAAGVIAFTSTSGVILTIDDDSTVLEVGSKVQLVDLPEHTNKPGSPAANRIRFYTSDSGVLLQVNESGAVSQVGLKWINTLTALNTTVATGGANAGPVNNCFAGGSGKYLGQPDNFLVFIDKSGNTGAVPFYHFNTPSLL